MDRDHDVAVAGRVAAIDARIGHPLVVDEHRALARRHRELDAGQAGDAPGPRPRCRYDHFGATRSTVPDRMSAIERPRYGRRSAPCRRPGGSRASLPRARARQGCRPIAPRLDGGVRDAEGAPDAGFIAGSAAARRRPALPRTERPMRRSARGTPRRSPRGRPGSRRTARRCPRCTTGDPPQDAVLVDALARRDRVLRHVTGARVKQAVVAPRRAGAEVALLHEQTAQSPSSQVAQQPPVAPPPTMRTSTSFDEPERDRAARGPSS